MMESASSKYSLAELQAAACAREHSFSTHVRTSFTLIRRTLFLFITLLFAALVRGQDTAYISQFSRLRNVQLNTWVTDVDFSVNPRLVNSDYKVTLTPNVKGQLGV